MRRGSAPPPGTWPISSSATPRCWTGSVRAFDGPGQLADADAWYFILEGTREPSVAEAQALAMTELAARAATSHGRPATGHPARRR